MDKKSAYGQEIPVQPFQHQQIMEILIGRNQIHGRKQIINYLPQIQQKSLYSDKFLHAVNIKLLRAKILF